MKLVRVGVLAGIVGLASGLAADAQTHFVQGRIDPRPSPLLAAAAPVTLAPHAWSPTVADLLADYRAGDLKAVLRETPALRAHAEETVRRDAAILEALCLLRLPGRADRMEGRARLAQLAQEDRSLLGDPECNLAYGIAQGALGATGDALLALERARAGFAFARQPDRLLFTLVALAEVWALHNEWELTPPHLDVPRPDAPEAAQRTRRAQIEKLRGAATDLPDSESAQAEIDVVLARQMLAGGEADAAMTLLKDVAERHTEDDVGSAAAFLVAQQHESAGRIDDALDWFARVRGPDAPRARDRAAALRRPDIRVELDGALAPGAPLRASIEVRNLDAVDVELRELNLESWLAPPQRRGLDALLPEEGAVRLARQVSRPAGSDPRATWRAAEPQDPLVFNGDPGAYALIVRGRDADGRETKIKRPVVVSELRALTLVDPQTATVWVLHGDTAPPQAVARFWMQGSFAPVETTLNGGLGRFSLPPEAQVMRDRRWTCVVRAGEHLALSRGELAPPVAAPAPRIALFGGPAELQVGQTWTVSGFVLGAAPGAYAGERVKLTATDATDTVVFEREVELDHAGTFQAAFDALPEWEGRHLRLVGRLGNRVLRNVLQRLVTRVVPRREQRYVIRCELPPVHPALTAPLPAAATLTAGSGAPATGEVLFTHVHAKPLPTSGSHAHVHSALVKRAVRVDYTGRHAFEIPWAEWNLAPGPAAVYLRSQAGGARYITGTGAAEALVGVPAPHLWITHEPEEWEVGAAGRFQLGWFEAGGLALAEWPTVTVLHGEQPIETLPLAPTYAGLATPPWAPRAAGDYSARVAVNRSGRPLTVEDRFTVRAALTADMADAEVKPRAPQFEARLPEENSVEARAVGATGPCLAIVEQDGLLGAAALAPAAAADGSTAEIELTAPPLVGTRVAFVTADHAGFLQSAVRPVRRDAATLPELRLSAAAHDAWPGEVARIDVDVDNAADIPVGTILVAHLSDARETGYLVKPLRHEPEPIDGIGRTRLTPSYGARLDWPTAESAGVSDRRAPGDTDETTSMAIPDDPLEIFLAAGQTLWSSAQPFDGPAQLEVRLPPEPRLYRLQAALLTADGGLREAVVHLDARAGVFARADVPPALSVGDRTVLGLLVGNDSAAERVCRLRLELDSALHLEAVRTLAPRIGALPRGAQGDYELKLAAGEQLWINADIEAAQPGAARVAVEVTDGERSVRTQTSSTVRAPALASATTQPAVRLTRELRAWTPPIEESAGESLDPNLIGDPHQTQPARWPRRKSRLEALGWQSRALQAGEAVAVGELVQVRETFTLTQPQTAGGWEQPAPANTWPLPEALADAETPAAHLDPQGSVLRYTMPALPAGTHVHEYFLPVVRPGSCLLPPPVWETAAGPANVRVEPAEVRLLGYIR